MNENVVKAEQAFNQASAGYELWGKQLEHFSAMRQATAAAMGLRFGTVDENDIFTITIEMLKDGTLQKQNLQFYNQMFQDVVFVIWLCSIPTSEVLKAMRNTDRAKEKAFQWADDNEISITSSHYFEAAAKFFEIMIGIATSTGVPQPVEGESEDEDPNE